jgi:hypothetical protein
MQRVVLWYACGGTCLIWGECVTVGAAQQTDDHHQVLFLLWYFLVAVFVA